MHLTQDIVSTTANFCFTSISLECSVVMLRSCVAMVAVMVFAVWWWCDILWMWCSVMFCGVLFCGDVLWRCSVAMCWEGDLVGLGAAKRCSGGDLCSECRSERNVTRVIHAEMSEYFGMYGIAMGTPHVENVSKYNGSFVVFVCGVVFTNGDSCLVKKGKGNTKSKSSNVPKRSESSGSNSKMTH